MTTPNQTYLRTKVKAKLRPGNMRSAVLPILSIVGGSQPYLWIGNDAPGDMHCYGTITLPRLMRLLERASAKRDRGT